MIRRRMQSTVMLNTIGVACMLCFSKESFATINISTSFETFVSLSSFIQQYSYDMSLVGIHCTRSSSMASRKDLYAGLAIAVLISSTTAFHAPTYQIHHHHKQQRRWGMHSSTSCPPPQAAELLLDEFSQEFYQMNLNLVGSNDENSRDNAIEIGGDGVVASNGIGNSASESSSSDEITKLCKQLGASPIHLFRLQMSSDGVRGLYLNRPVKEGKAVLSIPLESCITDTSYPSWLKIDDENDGFDSDHKDNPSAWATRLGASFIDLYLRLEAIPGDLEVMKHSSWISLLPSQEYLKASLPVHWDEDTVLSAKSTALELAVDTAYFARAEATNDLMASLRQSEICSSKTEEEILDLCVHALDIVQTRSCRLGDDDDAPIRVLAPIFDFINHGSLHSGGDSAANVCFKVENTPQGDTHVVVRALYDLKQDEEILVDYGESAQPAWKCLVNYGFVPAFKGDTSPGDLDDEESGHIAEVFIDGIRFEIGPSFLPFEIVEKMAAKLHVGTRMIDDDDGEFIGDYLDVALTPEIAEKIAQRISEVAYLLLLEPELDLYDDHPSVTPTAFQVISTRLSSSLRWHQHRVLLACAKGLQQYYVEDQDKTTT